MIMMKKQYIKPTPGSVTGVSRSRLSGSAMLPEIFATKPCPNPRCRFSRRNLTITNPHPTASRRSRVHRIG